MARYLRARTAFFDRVVVNAPGRGVRQVLTVGAGYDGRADLDAGVKALSVGAENAIRANQGGAQACQIDRPARWSQLGVRGGHDRMS